MTLTDHPGTSRDAFVFVPPSLEATAHHGAGHAVVAMATGLLHVDGPIAYSAGEEAQVSIATRQDRVQAWFGAGGSGDAFKELTTIAYAAGTEAERIYQLQCGQTPDERQLFAGAHGDIKVFAELVGSGLWNAYRVKACAVLQRPEIWAAVCSLAEALIESWPDPFAEGDAISLIGAIEPATPIVSF